MKRCPQCNKVFQDSIDFCLDDGTQLVEEAFVLPTENTIETEEETIIHHEPIKIDIRRNHHSEVVEIPEVTSQPNTVVPIIVEKEGNTGKYLLFLFVGLLLGGGLVIATLWFAYSRLSNSNNTQPETVQVSSGKHITPNKTRQDSEFNGFVLSENANIRSSAEGNILDTLPQNDRLNILERDNAWYRVVCEHGIGGWMHGNTIRFKDNENPF